jgi:hypothetical protein
MLCTSCRAFRSDCHDCLSQANDTYVDEMYISIHIMPSNIPKHSSTPSHTRADTNRSGDGSGDSHSHRRVRVSPIMFSDPIEDFSSDVESFDEDDMYGTDSEIESIPLNVPHRRDILAPEHDSVCAYLVYNLSVLTHNLGFRDH